MATWFRRAVWLVLSAGIVGAAPAPPQAVVDAPSGDRVNAFAGDWTCRTVEGMIVRRSGTRSGDTIVVRADADWNGRHSFSEDRYVFDPPLQRWHVVLGIGGFAGGAGPWVGDSWSLLGVNGDGASVRVMNEALPGGDLRRTFAVANTGGWSRFTAERCVQGVSPPPADACIVENYPASTLEAAQVKPWQIPPNAPSGTVGVLVRLDENSRITETRVVRSTAPELNLIALATTRASRFRTAIVNCTPIAASYIFTVDIGR